MMRRPTRSTHFPYTTLFLACVSLSCVSRSCLSLLSLSCVSLSCVSRSCVSLLCLSPVSLFCVSLCVEVTWMYYSVAPPTYSSSPSESLLPSMTFGLVSLPDVSLPGHLININMNASSQHNNKSSIQCGSRATAYYSTLQ